MQTNATLIDTHCHLTHGRLRQRADEIIQNAYDAGVTRIICAAADVHETKAAHGMAAKYDNVFFTAGIHPHEAKHANEIALEQIEQLAKKDKNAAIGEIGLDYHYDFSPRPEQQAAFEKQLELAKRLSKPIVIHSREAFDDTWAILKNSGVDLSRVLFHSFTYEKDVAQLLIDNNVQISYSGIVTFKTADYLRKAAAITPIEKMLVETDGPFLSPVPVRKMKNNEPANVAHIARCLAEVKNISYEEFCNQTTINAERFFDLN